MANSAVSIWFDLFVNGGMAEAGMAKGPESLSDPANRTKGMMPHHVPVSSLIIRNVYWGDLGKANGSKPTIGPWEWIPRCIDVPEKVCGFPLPATWAQTVRGGWHWGEREAVHNKEFLALDRDKPHGTKIGAITNFKVEDFAGYNPQAKRTEAWNFNASFGHWVINDGSFSLSGTWRFVNLIFR